jgi:hypothetical protein
VGQYLQIVAVMYGMAVKESGVSHPIQLEMWYGMESRQHTKLWNGEKIDETKAGPQSTHDTLYIVRRRDIHVVASARA